MTRTGWLDGATAYVTGGAGGIGRGIVERFVSEGARVTVLDRDPERLDDLEKAVGDSIRTVQGDATKLESHELAVSTAIDAFGSLDVLVANVGVWDWGIALNDLPSEKVSAAFDELFAVNVKGYLFATKAALPHLLESEGSIVYTVSNSGFYPQGGGPLYIASKFAVRGLVTQLAFELAPRVRVNGVAPGGTLTNIGGLSTLGQAGKKISEIPNVDEVMKRINPLHVCCTPEDHSWAYLYLASKKQSRVVTGTFIHTDGGIGVRGIGLEA